MVLILKYRRSFYLILDNKTQWHRKTFMSGSSQYYTRKMFSVGYVGITLSGVGGPLPRQILAYSPECFHNYLFLTQGQNKHES